MITMKGVHYREGEFIGGPGVFQILNGVMYKTQLNGLYKKGYKRAKKVSTRCLINGHNYTPCHAKLNWEEVQAMQALTGRDYCTHTVRGLLEIRHIDYPHDLKDGKRLVSDRFYRCKASFRRMWFEIHPGLDVLPATLPSHLYRTIGTAELQHAARVLGEKEVKKVKLARDRRSARSKAMEEAEQFLDTAKRLASGWNELYAAIEALLPDTHVVDGVSYRCVGAMTTASAKECDETLYKRIGGEMIEAEEVEDSSLAIWFIQVR